MSCYTLSILLFFVRNLKYIVVVSIVLGCSSFRRFFFFQLAKILLSARETRREINGAGNPGLFVPAFCGAGSRERNCNLLASGWTFQVL